MDNSIRNSNPQEQPDFIRELEKDRDKELRARIKQKIDSHVFKNYKSHKEVWRDVYSRFESHTGYVLPGKARMDYIQDSGLLGVMYKLVQHLSQ